MKNRINELLKRYVKIILATSIFLVIIIGLIIKFNQKEDNIIIDSDYLYETVEKYLIDKEIADNSKLKVDDFNVFSDFAHLGIKKKGSEIYVYIWALIESYYVENNELKEFGYSTPFKFVFKDNKIISFAKPEFGFDYKETIDKIFPKDISAKFDDNIISTKNIDLKVGEHYSYLKRYYRIEDATEPTKKYIIFKERAIINDIFHYLHYLDYYVQSYPNSIKEAVDYKIYFGDDLRYTITIKNDDYYIKQIYDDEAHQEAILTWTQQEELSKIINKYFG